MADRTRALLQVLGQGLWQKALAEVREATRPAGLWAGIQPSRLGTLGLLRELRDTTTGASTRWHPSSRYGHLDNEQWNNLDLNFNRLLDQLHPVEHLTDSERKVIEGYQKDPSSYRWDRGSSGALLRVPQEIGKHQHDLYDLLQASELPLDMNAYRGLTVRSNSSPDRSPLLTSPPREGDVLGSRGFMSTSVDPSSAWDFLSGHSGERSYLADIYLPTGTRALPIRTGDSYDKERELLLSPGQRYRVAGEPEPFGGDFNAHRLRLEALHPDDPYQAPEHLHTMPKGLGSRSAFQPPSDQPREPRGHYAQSGVLGYLAGLGPLAALATPALMNLYQKDTQ